MAITMIKKFIHRKFAMTTLLGSLLLGGVSAQHPCGKSGDGTLSGRLRDVFCNTGVINAAITIKGDQIKRKLKSDSDGKFELCLPAGKYQITVDRYAFKRYIMNDIQVRKETNTPINIDMERGYDSDDPSEGQPQQCPPPNKRMQRSAQASLVGTPEIMCAPADARR